MEPSPSDEVCLLQRGRARAGAEIDYYSVKVCFAWVASTGPRPRGRGNYPILNSSPRFPLLLQRGRARAGAEIGSVLAGSGSTIGFNGAAPARARKCKIISVEYLEQKASTGPRPRGRGNWKLCVEAAVVSGALQRGRARAGAEIDT